MIYLRHFEYAILLTRGCGISLHLQAFVNILLVMHASRGAITRSYGVGKLQ